MANTAPNTKETLWTSAQYNHSVAKLAWAAVEGEIDCSARQQAALSLEDSKNILYSAPALDIGAVIEKLAIWWGEELSDDSFESSQKRIVIGDLRRLEKLHAGMTEYEASHRSPEEVAMLANAWREALVEHRTLTELLVAGDEISLEGLMHAESELLELPAPNIAGVVRKLELLMETDRFDTVMDWSFSYYVICDLNRLGSATERRASDQQ